MYNLRNLCIFTYISQFIHFIMIGRKKETEILNKAFTSSKPELVVLIGRRRVGKTFLVRSFFGGGIDFEIVGLKDGAKEQQLRNFTYSLKDAKGSNELPSIPKDWLEAFHQLKEHLTITWRAQPKKSGIH